MCNNYMYILILFFSFALSFLYNKNYELSLFIGLLILYSITIINYDYKYLFIPIILYVISIITKFNKKNINIINFVLIYYGFLSIMELLGHKYAMHCDQNSFLYKYVKNIPYINEEYLTTCKTHTQHHSEVEPDMTLNGNKYRKSLFMGWDIFIPLVITAFVGGLVSKKISKFNISYKYLLLISIISAFAWEYLWNKVHTKMHDYEIEYSINEGPYDENLFNLDIFKDILLDNHRKHHIQKGEKKGNYGVIILGADEWFGLNNKIIDNEEYCKNNSNDKICK